MACKKEAQPEPIRGDGHANWWRIKQIRGREQYAPIHPGAPPWLV